MLKHTVMVVGAGIVGASIAYHLSARGAQVTILDAEVPGAGASRHSFGWIGKSPWENSPAGQSRALGLQHWKRLAAEVPGLDLHWSGALVWGEDFAGGTDPISQEQAALHEPRLLMPPSQAGYKRDDGWLDPTRAAQALVRAAQRLGAHTSFGTPVTRVHRASDGAVVGVELGSETLLATTVVVAAGVGSAALCRTAGAELAMVSSPAVMVRLSAPQGLVRGIVANDEFEVRQSPDGTVLMPLDYHHETSTEELLRTAERARALFVDSFDGARDARSLSAEIGWRPMTADSQPRVGYSEVPGLYIAVVHPGVTLAAAVGDTAARDIAQQSA